jgi:hypothetical protein
MGVPGDEGIAGGGILELVMGEKANKNGGTVVNNAPLSDIQTGQDE